MNKKLKKVLPVAVLVLIISISFPVCAMKSDGTVSKIGEKETKISSEINNEVEDFESISLCSSLLPEIVKKGSVNSDLLNFNFDEKVLNYSEGTFNGNELLLFLREWFNKIKVEKAAECFSTDIKYIDEKSFELIISGTDRKKIIFTVTIGCLGDRDKNSQKTDELYDYEKLIYNSIKKQLYNNLPTGKLDAKIKLNDYTDKKLENQSGEKLSELETKSIDKKDLLNNYLGVNIALYINDYKKLKQISLISKKMQCVVKTLKTNPCPVGKDRIEDILNLLLGIETLRITDEGSFNPGLKDENLIGFNFDKLIGLKVKSKIKIVKFEKGTFIGKELVELLQLPEIYKCKKDVKFYRGQIVENGTDFILIISGPDGKEIRFDVSFGYLDRERALRWGYFEIANIYSAIVSLLPARFFTKKEDIYYIPETKTAVLFRRGYSPDLDNGDLLNFYFKDLFEQYHEVKTIHFKSGSFNIKDLIKFLNYPEIQRYQKYISPFLNDCIDARFKLTIIDGSKNQIIFDVDFYNREFLFGGLLDGFILKDKNDTFIENLRRKIKILISDFPFLDKGIFRLFPGTETLVGEINGNLIDFAEKFFSGLFVCDNVENAKNICFDIDDIKVLEMDELQELILYAVGRGWKKEIEFSDCDKYYIKFSKDDGNQEKAGTPDVKISIIGPNGKKIIFFIYDDNMDFFDLEYLVEAYGSDDEFQRHNSDFFEKFMIKDGTFVSPKGIGILDFLDDFNRLNIKNIIVSGDVIVIKTNQFVECNFEKIFISEGVQYIKKKSICWLYQFKNSFNSYYCDYKFGGI